MQYSSRARLSASGIVCALQACIDNNAELVAWLLERGAAIDVHDLEGWTPLHAAAHCGYMEIAK